MGEELTKNRAYVNGGDSRGAGNVKQQFDLSRLGCLGPEGGLFCLLWQSMTRPSGKRGDLGRTEFSLHSPHSTLEIIHPPFSAGDLFIQTFKICKQSTLVIFQTGSQLVELFVMSGRSATRENQKATLGAILYTFVSLARGVMQQNLSGVGLIPASPSLKSTFASELREVLIVAGEGCWDVVAPSKGLCVGKRETGETDTSRQRGRAACGRPRSDDNM